MRFTLPISVRTSRIVPSNHSCRDCQYTEILWPTTGAGDFGEELVGVELISGRMRPAAGEEKSRLRHRRGELAIPARSDQGAPEAEKSLLSLSRRLCAGSSSLLLFAGVERLIACARSGGRQPMNGTDGRVKVEGSDGDGPVASAVELFSHEVPCTRVLSCPLSCRAPAPRDHIPAE